MADALFSATQQRVLGVLFGQVNVTFSLSELFERADAGRGAVQRELQRLVESGLVSVVEVDGRKRYRAHADAPIFAELRAIVGKLFGVEKIVGSALMALRDRIDLAILYGSTAKGTATADSDIDVLIVSDVVTLEELFAALAAPEEQLRRKINPTLYTSDEFARRKAEHHPFLTKVLEGKHHVLLEHRVDRTAR